MERETNLDLGPTSLRSRGTVEDDRQHHVPCPNSNHYETLWIDEF
jgi:hypothetical protein